jgi:hypothetical protein
VPGAAKGKLNFKHTDRKGTEVSGEHPDDFVWAFCLSRVSRGHFSKTLEVEPYKDGAVLAPSDGKVDASAILAEEDLLVLGGGGGGDDDVHILEVLKGNNNNNSDEPAEQQFFVTIDGL